MKDKTYSFRKKLPLSEADKTDFINFKKVMLGIRYYDLKLDEATNEVIINITANDKEYTDIITLLEGYIYTVEELK